MIYGNQKQKMVKFSVGFYNAVYGGCVPCDLIKELEISEFLEYFGEYGNFNPVDNSNILYKLHKCGLDTAKYNVSANTFWSPGEKEFHICFKLDEK